MGFFTNEKCAICGETVGTFSSIYLDEGVFICDNCQKNAGVSENYSADNLKHLSVNEIKKRIEEFEKNSKENLLRIEKFKTTYQIQDIIWFDDDDKMFVIPFLNKIDNCHVINYKEIVEYEIIEDGEVQFKGGFGKALICSALLSHINPLLSVVGGVAVGTSKKVKKWCNKLQVKITTKNSLDGILYINLISTPVKSKSSQYKDAFNKAQEIISKFQIITSEVKENDSQKINSNNFSVADEIRKFKELLDDGAITQDEYETKKKELLK